MSHRNIVAWQVGPHHAAFKQLPSTQVGPRFAYSPRMKKSTKRLALKPHTLRALTPDDLTATAGGWGIQTIYCPQSGSPFCNIILTGK